MKRLGFLVFVVFAAASLVSWNSRGKLPAPQPISTTNARAMDLSLPSTVDPNRPAREVEGVAKEPAPDAPPSAETLRSEIAENPESTPAGLLSFAKSLGQELANAIGSEDGAREDLRRLRNCLESDDVAPAAQVLCLRHAELLAARYPSLAPTVEKISEEAPERAREIAAAMEPLN